MPYWTDEPDDALDVMWPDPEWAPTYWVGMKSHRTLGHEIADFIELVMSPPRKWNDAPFKVLPWQRWWLCHAFELDENGLLRWREVYLQIPRKNGKSFLVSGINLYFLTKAEEGDQLLLAASSRKQAGIVYDECLRNLNNSRLLQKVLKPGANRITNRYINAYLERVSGDGDSSQGAGAFLATGDELHTWDSATGRSNRGQNLLDSLTTGSADRIEHMFLGITTAGEHLDGIAYGRYEKTKALAIGALEDENFHGTIWEAEEFDDIGDPETWMKANPNLRAGLMPMDEFQKLYDSAITTSTAGFERYHLNKWLRGGDKAQFISGTHWKNAYREGIGTIPLGAEIAVGFDGSWTEDSTGIIGIDINTGLVQVLYGWEKDPLDPDWFVDSEEVNAAMAQVFKDYKVVKLYADPSRHRENVALWQRTWGRGVVRDIPPSNQRMPSMSQEFRQAVYTGGVVHNGDKRLTTHVLNAIETVKGVPNKESSGSARKIDFLACAILAHGAMTEHLTRSKGNGGVFTFG